MLVGLISYRTIYWICAAVIVASAGYLPIALRGSAQLETPTERDADPSVPAPEAPTDVPHTDTVVGGAR